MVPSELCPFGGLRRLLLSTLPRFNFNIRHGVQEFPEEAARVAHAVSTRFFHGAVHPGGFAAPCGKDQ
jgi:hypothetical protein